MEKKRTWLNVIDELLSLLAYASALYTADVERAHDVVRSILAGQLTVRWLNQPVEDEGDEDA